MRALSFSPAAPGFPPDRGAMAQAKTASDGMRHDADLFESELGRVHPVEYAGGPR